MTMDFDLRLKALSRLAASTTDAASKALRDEIDKACRSLVSDTQYSHLEERLQILKVVGARASKEVVLSLLAFIERLKVVELTYSDQELVLGSTIKKFRNSVSLTVSAIDVLVQFRYLQVKLVLSALLELSRHDTAEIRDQATKGLQSISSYNIAVVVGEKERRGIGVQPQKEILEVISSLSDLEVQKHFGALLALSRNLLSPTMEGASSTYNAVVFSRGAVPHTPGVAGIRMQVVGLLKRIYWLGDGVVEKLAVIAALVEATRLHDLGRDREASREMIVRDTLDVLTFFLGLALSDELSIVQKIEKHSYWIFYHAITPEIATSARNIEAAVAGYGEYQIYKVLIGFDGIFGDWQELKENRKPYNEVDEYRKKMASELALGIVAETEAAWRRRILKYAETQSNDLATFPVFYYFLSELATAHPRFAFELVSKHAREIDRFLIPLLRALSAGREGAAVRRLVLEWANGGLYLYPSIKQFLDNDNLDLELLVQLLDRAIESNDARSIAMAMAVAISNYTPAKRLLVDRLFLPALKALTAIDSADWVFEAWYRQEAKELITSLDDEGTDLVLCNLMNLQKIDYEAEEILYLIANKSPGKVLHFLCGRLDREKQYEAERGHPFDAVPFQLHKLNEPLSKIPREAVDVVRATYNGNYGMFIHRGGHLLHVIFPTFPEAFEFELLRILGNKNEVDVEFVLAILRNYEGEPFIHCVCKEIIRILPEDSALRTEVAVVLESTGVVSGEFGFAEAYEQKKNEVKAWLDDSDRKIRAFASWYVETLDQMIVAERKRAEEDIALRKQKYGE